MGAARNPPRYFLAVLGLLIPVATLAWLGSAEIGRQQQRASDALVEHAKSVLDDVDRELQRLVGIGTQSIHDRFDAQFGPLVDLDARMQAERDNVLGLVVLDEIGNLIYPGTPPEDAYGLPFIQPARIAEVRAAERLTAAGDLDGARRMLEDWLDTPPFERRRPGGPGASRQRAWFRLGALQLRRGALEEADLAFGYARRASRPRAESAALPLLCDVALAEIDCCAQWMRASSERST